MKEKAKYKAKELINKFLYPNIATQINFKIAKENATTLAKEVILELNNIDEYVDNRLLFWETVLEEIECISLQNI